MATTSELLTGARCIDVCIPDGMKLAVLIYLKQQQTGNTMTPSELMNAARCIDNCIPAGMMTSVLVYLENEGGGGGGGGGSVLCGTSDPTDPPSGSCAKYYRTDTGAEWYWDGSAWQPQITP